MTTSKWCGSRSREAGGAAGSGSTRRRARTARPLRRRPTARRRRGRAARDGRSRGSGRGSPRGARRRAAARAGSALAQPRVVERRHHRLAGARRRDQQVAVVAALAGERDLLEQPLLERLGPQLDRAQDERAGAVVCRAVVRARTRRRRRARSRRCSSSSRRRRRPCRRRRGCGRRTRGRSTRARSPARSASGSTSRCTPSRSPDSRWNSHAFACRRVLLMSYETRARRRRARAAHRAPAPRSSPCRSSSARAAPAPPRSARGAPRSSGAMPLRRMNAITTSMRSAEWISARTWLPTRGSPGAFVSSVVSSSGMSGCGMTSRLPSGSRPAIARRRVPVSVSASSRLVRADLRQEAIDELHTDLHALGLRNVLEGLLDRASQVQRDAVRGLGGPQGLADRLQMVRSCVSSSASALVRSSS